MKSSSVILSGRIDVDVDSIMKESGDFLFDIYDKYLESKSFDVGGSDPDEIDCLEIDSFHVVLYFKLVDAVINEFLFNNNYGLDSNLSVEFRHKQFETILWSPLKTLNLVTDIDKDSRFEDNYYWIDYYKILKPALRASINISLRHFSEDIVSLINEAEQDWCSLSDRESLFDFANSRHILSDLETSIELNSEPHSVVRGMLDILLLDLDEKLAGIREEVNVRLLSRFESAFDRLDASLSKSKGTTPLNDLEATVFSARSRVNESIDEICSWFNYSSKYESSDFEIGLPVKICNSFVRAMYQHRKFNFKFNENGTAEKMFGGRYMFAFYRIFLTLFENAFNHSKLPSGLIIDLAVTHDNNRMMIVLKNNVSRSVNLTKTREILSEVQEKIRSKAYSSLVNREGRTGFYKIDKMLSVNISAKHSLSFKITDDYLFEVVIDLDVEGLYV